MLPKSRRVGEEIKDNIRITKDGRLVLTDGESLKKFLAEWYRIVLESGYTDVHEDGTITVCLMSKTVQERIEAKAIIPHCA